MSDETDLPRPAERPPGVSRRVLVVEALVYLSLSVAWIRWLDSGTANGFGYFHQPDVDLLLPLISGTVFNAVTFFVHGFWLLPRCLCKRRFGHYLLGMAALFAGVVTLETTVDKLIIVLTMPSLAAVPFGSLALENSYIFAAFLIFSFLYRLMRDGISRLRKAF